MISLLLKRVVSLLTITHSGGEGEKYQNIEPGAETFTGLSR